MLEYFGKSMYNNNYLYSCKNWTLNLNWEKFSDLAFIHFFHSIDNTYWIQTGSTVQQINLLNNFRKVKSLEKTFYNCKNLNTVETSNWDTSNIVSLTSTFSYCWNLKNLDVSNWNTSNLKNLSNTFLYCNQLTDLDVSNWNTNNFTDLSNTYRFCKNLKTLDISNWDTGNIINLSATFFGCENLTNLDVSNWNINNVTNLSGIFYSCFRLNNLDVSQWNIKNVTNLWWTFYNCYNLKNLDVSNWDISNVTNLSGVFYNCKNLKILNISNWNTSRVDSLNTAFFNCGNLNELDVSNWDIGNVRNLAYIFYNCWKLNKIDVSNWDTSNVWNLSYTFDNCTNLNKLDVSNWDMSNVWDLCGTFAYCNRLQDLDVSNWNISKATNLSYTFYYSNSLTTLNLSNWDISNVITLEGTFSWCNHLQLWDENLQGPEDYDLKLRTFNLTNWDTSNIINMVSTFTGMIWDPYYYNELNGEIYKYIDYDIDTTNLITFYNWNFINVISMSHFLKNAQFADLVFPQFSNVNWNTTGNVTNLSNTFAFKTQCRGWTPAIWWGPIPICNFYINTCNVTNLSWAFATNGYSINGWMSGNIDNWVGGEEINLTLSDVSKVINANNAFAQKNAFNWTTNSGSEWAETLETVNTFIQPVFLLNNTHVLNFYNVTDAGNMFYNYLANIPKIIFYNVTQFNFTFASNYNSDKSYWDPINQCFRYQNYFLNQHWDTTNWNLSKVTTMYRTFADRQFSNQDLKNIANALLTAVNVTSTYKNLNISNTSSPFYNAWTWINTATVGSDIASQLSAAGWIIPS